MWDVRALRSPLMRAKNPRRQVVHEMRGFLRAGTYYIGRGETIGSISESIRVADRALRDVPMTSPWFFHTIFVPEGSVFTLAEMDVIEFVKFDYKRKAVVEFLKGVLFRLGGQLELPY